MPDPAWVTPRHGLESAGEVFIFGTDVDLPAGSVNAGGVTSAEIERIGYVCVMRGRVLMTGPEVNNEDGEILIPLTRDLRPKGFTKTFCRCYNASLDTVEFGDIQVREDDSEFGSISASLSTESWDAGDRLDIALTYVWRPSA